MLSAKALQAQLDADENAKQARESFRLAKKLQAQFDAETETSADKHRESMIQQLKDRKQKILDAVRSLTLTLACIINYI